MTTKDISKVPMKELIFNYPKRMFLESGGNEEQFMREAGFAMQIINNNPYIAKCDRLSLVQAVANVSMTGLTLNPELKLAYLVPRKGRVYFQSSYMGKVEIMIQAGMVKDIYARLVYEKDDFRIEGTAEDSHIIHNYDAFADDRGKIRGGYYIAYLNNGIVKWDTMTFAQIEKRKKVSTSVQADKGSPWDGWDDEMSKKTIINWAFKMLPKTHISEKLMKILETDSELDNQVIKEKKENATDDFYDEDFTPHEEVIDNPPASPGKN